MERYSNSDTKPSVGHLVEWRGHTYFVVATRPEQGIKVVPKAMMTAEEYPAGWEHCAWIRPPNFRLVQGS